MIVVQSQSRLSTMPRPSRGRDRACSSSGDASSVFVAVNERCYYPAVEVGALSMSSNEPESNVCKGSRQRLGNSKRMHPRVSKRLHVASKDAMTPGVPPVPGLCQTE